MVEVKHTESCRSRILALEQKISAGEHYFRAKCRWCGGVSEQFRKEDLADNWPLRLTVNEEELIH